MTQKPTVKKAQVATEFLLYSSVFMLAVIVAYLLISQAQNTELPSRQNALARETGQGFSSALSLSVRGGSGFSYKYSFQKTLLGVPYAIDFSDLSSTNKFYFYWPGPFGNFSHTYILPKYSYRINSSGTCLVSNTLVSSSCRNTLLLNNDGENLIISQEAESG